MKFEIVRYEYEPDRTLGVLNIDNRFLCHTLEDKVRPDGIKVYGETAIPEGTYKITLEPFRGDKTKIYPHLHDVPMFEGICIHGGNKPEDTIGCILVGMDRTGSEISNCRPALESVIEKIKANQPAFVIVRNGG